MLTALCREQFSSLMNHSSKCNQHPLKCLIRGFFNNNRQWSNLAGGIESSRQMQKLLSKKGAKTKRKWYQPHVAEPLELSGRRQQPNKKGVSESQGHKARQISHVLYSKICQLANSGELSEELLNRHVLFTKVKLHPTFSGLNVYWDANRSDAGEIEVLLNSLPGKLRSLLISYHVLGRIPNITFVKDKARGDLTRLNELLEIADYGPDYVSSNSTAEAGANLSATNATASPSLERVPGTETTFLRQMSALSLHGHPGKVKTVGVNSVMDHVSQFSSEAGWQAESYDNGIIVKNGMKNSVDENLLVSSSNLYGLPRDELMKKVIAQKKKVKYQGESDGDNNLSPSDLQVDHKDYRLQLKVKGRDKERMLQQRDSTKMKQMRLEWEFVELQSLKGERVEEELPHKDFDEENDSLEHDDWERK